MRFIPFLLLVICQLAVVSGVSAQDDAGVDSGSLESLDPLAACMNACARRYELCVTDATIPQCIANVPECHGLAPRTTEIMAAFCDACGRAAVGCEAGTDPVVAPSVEERDPDPVAAAGDTRPRRRPTPEELERTAAARARSICERQRGIWDAESAILMPDGTLRLGICHTPEGAELAQMIRDEHEARAEEDGRLGRRITDEERARIAADRAMEDRVATIEVGDIARDSRIANLLAHIMCAESEADRIPLERLDGTTRRLLESDSGSTRDGYFLCNTPVERGVVIRVPAGTRVDIHRSSGHPTLFGEGWRPRLRLSLLGWVGFTPLHPTLAQMRGALASTPVGVGVEVTVLLPLYGGLYMEGGVGLTYDWPDFSPYATSARLWYHGGLAYYLVPEVSIGLGYLGTDRFRPTMQSAHSFHGAYLEISLHGRLRIVEGRLTSSPDVNDPAIVFTIRGAAGASIRPAADTAADGLIQALLGVEI